MIAVVAILALLPMLILGIVASHSSPYSIIWATQFSEQVRQGILYPRWLADSFDGLGSPTFYFYPPLVFWLDAIVSIVAANVLSVERRLGVLSLLILFGAGLAMHAWLRREGAGRGPSLGGAIAYMVAPYHLLDIYVRGALAESATYAVIPVIFLAIRLVAERRSLGSLLLTLSYAALLLTHLPTALLATVTLIPANVLFRAWRLEKTRPAMEFVARAMVAGALGGGLAAIYLAPALSLQGWIAADIWSAAYYSPRHWFVLAPEDWIEPAPHIVTRMIGSMALSATLVAVGLTVALPLVARASHRWEGAFWSAATLVILAMLVGLVPAVWEIPWIAAAQFPWRLMVLVEFSAITGMCVVWGRLQNAHGAFARALVALAATALVGAAVALVPGLRLMIVQAAIHVEHTADTARLPRYEAIEYVPRGYGEASAAGLGGIPTRNLEPAQSRPLIACVPAAAVCSAREEPLGAVSVTVESEEPTRVIVRRFAFPGWRADSGLAIGVADEVKLVSFVAPGGRTSLRLARVMLPVEKWGAAVSGLSLCLLVGVVVLSLRGNKLPAWLLGRRVPG